MSIFTQQAYYSGFLRRRQFGKNSGILCRCRQFFVAHSFHLRTQQHFFCCKSYMTANTFCDLFIVPCQYFHGNTMLLQSPDRSCSRFFGRIQKSQITDQNHFVLVCYRKSSYRRRIGFLRYGNDSQAIGIKRIHFFHNQLFHRSRQRHYTPCIFDKSRNIQHFLYGALGDHLRFPIPVFYYHTHPAPFKIKGQLIYLLVKMFQIAQLIFVFFLFQFRPADNGNIHQIFQTRLIITV